MSRHKKHKAKAAPTYPTITLAYEILRRPEKVILRVKRYGWEAEGPTEEQARTNFETMMQAKEQELADPSNEVLFREEKLAYVSGHLAWEKQYQAEMAEYHARLDWHKIAREVEKATYAATQ